MGRVSGCGDARVAWPLPHHCVCAWRIYLPFPSLRATRGQASASSLASATTGRVAHAPRGSQTRTAATCGCLCGTSEWRARTGGGGARRTGTAATKGGTSAWTMTSIISGFAGAGFSEEKMGVPSRGTWSTWRVQHLEHLECSH